MKEFEKMKKVENKTKFINKELFKISDTLNKERIEMGRLKDWKEIMRNIRKNIDEANINIRNILNELEIKEEK